MSRQDEAWRGYRLMASVLALPRVRVRRRRRRRPPRPYDIIRLQTAASFVVIGVVGAVVGAPAGASMCLGCGVWAAHVARRAWNRLLTPAESREFVCCEIGFFVGVWLAFFRV